MRSSAVTLALAFLVHLSSAPAFAQTVKLSLLTPALRPGAPVTLYQSTPYLGSDFRVFAASPTRNWFEVAAGKTLVSSGDGTITLDLVGDATLAGTNLIFRSEVVAEDGETVLRSDRVGVRVAELEGDPISSVPFEMALDRLPLGDSLAGDAVVAADLADIDGDDDLDLIAATADTAVELRVFVNDGSGRFTEESVERVPDDLAAAIGVIRTADVNGDGFADLFLGTLQNDPDNSLLLNDGTGVFSEQESFPDKSEEVVHSSGAVFADFDSDGDVDLFITNRLPAGHEGGEAVPKQNELLLNDGEGNFTLSESFAELELAPQLSRTAAAGDVDNDGDLDIVVANSGENRLLLNDGFAGFEDGSASLPPASDSTFGVELVDVDLDGDFDIVYANTMFNPFAQVVLVNQGGNQGGDLATFEAARLPMLGEGQTPIRLGLEVADIDADGDPDLLFAVHELGNEEAPDLYINQGGAQGGEAGEFLYSVTFEASSGIYNVMPTGDLDSDGDIDMLGLVNGTTDPDVEVVPNYVLVNPLFDSADPPLAFKRGDANGDLERDVSDAIFGLTFQFLGLEAPPPCEKALDVDGNGIVDVTDPIVLLSHLFLGVGTISPPFPGFGDEPVPTDVSCDRVRIFE